ncbi:hypothetical protein OG520_43140 (plasmid) [Streptomyces sp. NBC_00984]|uniref:hypothetical protein n=1 Tax=Streptomyces sp. NBC_00984 TaxID=2903700 RepID=UPI002F911F83|nr:hypothetical protein OG520_43140 [Streptomyces sp. NBC_00984]
MADFPDRQEPSHARTRKRRKDGKHTEITFVLPADTPPGPVSVVDDFNDWQQGTHELRPRKGGTRAAHQGT